MPPFTSPRVRIAIYADKLVAIPLMIPLQYYTLQFKDIVGIDIRGEETPSGTMYYRYRKYGHNAEDIVAPGLRGTNYKSLRGYLYSGLGDLGTTTPEDDYLVILRTKQGIQPCAVNVQGMGIEKLRDVLDSSILSWRQSVGLS
jgi:hypothetical protein